MASGREPAYVLAMVDRPRKPPYGKPAPATTGRARPPRGKFDDARPAGRGRADDSPGDKPRARPDAARGERDPAAPPGKAPRPASSRPAAARPAAAPTRSRNEAPAAPREAGEPALRLPGTGDPAAWLYGTHAVRAALANPARRPRRLLVATDGDGGRAADWAALLPPGGIAPELVDRNALDRALPAGAIHQGVALKADPLEPPALEDLLAALEHDGLPRARFMVLDQVTDPHNVGAILRSSAAFGATAIIMTDRHAPALTGALAKAASGAVERVPVVRVVNLARSLRLMRDYQIHCVGLAGEAEADLDAALAGRREGPIALVVGAEGDGLRRLTAETCDVLARLPTVTSFDTLNVSNAAAIALFAARPPARPEAPSTTGE